MISHVTTSRGLQIISCKAFKHLLSATVKVRPMEPQKTLLEL